MNSAFTPSARTRHAISHRTNFPTPLQIVFFCYLCRVVVLDGMGANSKRKTFKKFHKYEKTDLSATAGRFYYTGL